MVVPQTLNSEYEMPEIKFKYHHTTPRKDLLDFIEERTGIRVLEHIGENSGAWIEELNIISQALTDAPLVGGTNIDSPPVDEPDFRELGDGAFHYRGKYDRLRGLWIQRDGGTNLEEITGSRFEWTHYRMSGRAVLGINPEFSEIPPERFFPENFEQIAKQVEKEEGSKRPIWTFPVVNNGEEIVVFAKGADVSLRLFYEESKPSYRLTPIAGISKTTSEREMEITLKLGDLGVNVPRIIGHYKALAEEFLFLEEVKGKRPDDFLPEYNGEIIRQDAEMLAALCLAGYRKIGFNDFDDKIFDGTDLSLIDVDECRDLYFPYVPDFEKILLNPKDSSELRRFRNLQRDLFVSTMRDVIFRYKDSLTPTDKDKADYTRAFYQRMGWRKPDERKMKKLITFPKDYMTNESWMGMMCEE